MMKRYIFLITGLIFFHLTGTSQSFKDEGLVNTSNSQHALLKSAGIRDVKWTNGFWAERMAVCENAMVPHMMANYLDTEISHAFRNFEIAAGLMKGEHKGPPFHDGDFYKMLEAMIMVYGETHDENTGREIDSIINVIAGSQREDGYIHTPVVIGQNDAKNGGKEFGERLDFETYNMGHLMTAACIHYRVTGKKNLLNVAVKAADFLYDFYKNDSTGLARNAICPSHYMGIVEMYRTIKDPKYLELAQGMINIRDYVVNGTDHNQDRIPFRQQTKAVGHAVRANYLYAGVADVYMETGEDSLYIALDKIWHNLVERKMYITGACGALYDGVSPDGTSYSPAEIQQVHQAYGRDYQLPNLTAHNESCANIGNILWNWRMFLATGEARFMDVTERILYNSLLAGVSLDGKGYFYTNPLCVADDITYNLRWSKEREPYISYCNCCPPNTIRTIAEIQNYAYSLSDKGLWVNLYGGSGLNTRLKDGSTLRVEQISDYPWDGRITLKIEELTKDLFSVFLRIPAWADNPEILVNGENVEGKIISGSYYEIKRKWKKGDLIELNLSIKVKLIESNPLVEETRNQVAIQRGPVVYCLESPDLPGQSIFDVIIPGTIQLTPVEIEIKDARMVALEGEALLLSKDSWQGRLYREIPDRQTEKASIRLIPYFAWDNRGKSEMTVWLLLLR